MLQSAASQPQASFGGQWLHATLHEMAAAYLFSLVMNHPFVDGNKRVGAMAALAFLEKNGIEVVGDPDAYADLVLAVASGRAGKADVIDFMRLHARPLPDGDITP